MTLTIPANTGVVFDLDDTLYKEVDFVQSALRAIARACCSDWLPFYSAMDAAQINGEHPIDYAARENRAGCTTEQLVQLYREHSPEIACSDGARHLLERLRLVGCYLGIITDGRSITQRNKLRALGIVNWFDLIVISEEFGSEKPAEANYRCFMERFPAERWWYFGDNIRKDFVTPNRLGWTTVGIKDDGRNVHSQNVKVPAEFLPQQMIRGFEDVAVGCVPRASIADR